MWISDFSIRNPVITTVVMLALVVFGVLSMLMLDTDEFPNVDPPVIAVTVAYPGASPQTVEREVIDVMEEAFASISSVDQITSTAMDSLATIIVEFDFDKDLQEASQDIRDKISEQRRDLPLEMEEPVLTRFDPNDLPIVSLTLSSTRLSPADLTRLADPESDLCAARRAGRRRRAHRRRARARAERGAVARCAVRGRRRRTRGGAGSLRAEPRSAGRARHER